MFADAFLARDRAAFRRSDDFLPHIVDLAVEVFHALAQRIVFRQSRARLRDFAPQKDDPVHQRALIVEQRAHFQRSIELRFLLRVGELRARIKANRKLGLVGLVVFREANGVLSGSKPDPTRPPKSDLRGGRNARRLFAHAPHDAI